MLIRADGVGASDVEAEVDDVALLHHVVLAFEPEQPLLARRGVRAGAHEGVVGDDLGAYEAALDVRVDDAGGLRGARAARYGPGAHLLPARRQERHQAEQPVGAPDEFVHAARLDPQLTQVTPAVFGRERDQLGFELRADRDALRALLRRDLAHGADVRVRPGVGERRLVNVGRVDGRLRRQQEERAGDRSLGVVEFGGAGRSAFGEHGEELVGDIGLGARGLVAALRGLLRALAAAFDRGEVGEREFDLDGLDVAARVDRALDVVHVLVLEAADDLYDGVGLADVGEELVAQALALGRAAHQPRDV